MILLMGMWINFTKNPIKPIIQKPMAVATAIFWNSERNRTSLVKHKHYVHTENLSLKLTFPVRLCTSFHKTYGVFGKLFARFNKFSYLIHSTMRKKNEIKLNHESNNYNMQLSCWQGEFWNKSNYENVGNIRLKLAFLG